jgi:hypothetical protein
VKVQEVHRLEQDLGEAREILMKVRCRQNGEPENEQKRRLRQICLQLLKDIS